MAVVIPVFNERALLPRLIARLDATSPPRMPDGTPVERTLVVIDDGSTDGTRKAVQVLDERTDTSCVFHPQNLGKGAALASGFARAIEINADAAIVQDADLEYDPADHAAALAPILDGRADAVIGSRFIGQTHRVLYYWHSVANRGLTMMSNMLSNLNLTDIECGTKVFNRDVLAKLRITERRFGVEPELIAQLARMRLPDPNATDSRGRPLRVYEVPVSYAGRTYAEGKKIGWRDGLDAIRAILRHNLLPPRPPV